MKKKKRVSSRKKSRISRTKKIRYGVIGLGYFAQTAILPAFAHTQKNSQLVALFSDDPVKLKKLGKKYKASIISSYDEMDTVLLNEGIDAVYIAVPNSLHRFFAEKAARYGVHVLCEKPLAVTSDDCQSIMDTCNENKVKLMVAYRLHFEQANLKTIQTVQSGKIGTPRFFNSTFSMQVKAGNIRLDADKGGGTLYDIGIYCINAARYLFRSEPIEVMAFSAKNNESRFKEVDEMTSATLRFPNDRLATFITSFGAADVGRYQVVGTKGSVTLDPAYEFAGALDQEVRVGDKKTKQHFSKRDQIAPEILYFSDCILKNKKPEPSGEEGLADVRIIEALYESAKRKKAISLDEFQKIKRPTIEQEDHQPAVDQPLLIHADQSH